MTAKRLKTLKKENNKEEILASINKIINGDFIWLDIVKMKWKIGYYRCRIGKIRIIFFEKESKYFVEKIGYRWDVYK